MTHSSRVFRQEGEYWTVRYAGTVVRVRDAKGLRYVAHLLDHPGHGFSAGELVGGRDGTGCRRNPERARLAVTQRIKACLKKIHAIHPALGHHLAARIKTGSCCTYTPEPERDASWKL